MKFLIAVFFPASPFIPTSSFIKFQPPRLLGFLPTSSFIILAGICQPPRLFGFPFYFGLEGVRWGEWGVIGWRGLYLLRDALFMLDILFYFTWFGRFFSGFATIGGSVFGAVASFHLG